MATIGKFQVWQSNRDGLWYWHLKSAGNGERVCWGEGYSTKQAALNSISWVKAYAGTASVEEL